MRFQDDADERRVLFLIMMRRYDAPTSHQRKRHATRVTR